MVAGPDAASAAVPSTKAPLLERTDDVITSDPLPTVQIDSGYVWAQTTIGTTVYAAGSFSNARGALAEPGTALTPRNNILAYDITTGALLPFAPVVNGVIKSIAASPDGTRIYIGGTFTQVNGQARYNVAALDAQTGLLVPGFAPAIGGTGVYAIAATADTVYLGGSFTQANGVARKNLAALASSNAAVRPWASTTDMQVDAMVIEPGGERVIIGGRFYYVNDAVQRGLAALDPVTADVDADWAAPQTVKNGSREGKSGIFGLTTDSHTVYGTGWSYLAEGDRGNLEGVFAAEPGSGAIRWVADCHGDNYGVYSTGEVVYSTSHTHAYETVNLWPEQKTRAYRYMLAFTTTAEGTLSRSATAGSTYSDWSGTPSPSAYAVTPDFTVGTATGLGQAGLSITGAGDYIAVAGEFTTVNNRRYQGIVRFSTKPEGGAKEGPRLAGTGWVPTAASVSPGRVDVSIPSNWDRDDHLLTYQLFRSDLREPVDAVTASSVWWTRANISLSDRAATAGEPHEYTVRAVDPDGNTAVSGPVTATAQPGEPSEYANLVLDDGAQVYYPLGEFDMDWTGATTPRFGASVSSTEPGAVHGVTGRTASAFTASDATPDGVSAARTLPGDNDFAAEAWIQTSTKSGGEVFGFGSSMNLLSSQNDRVVYMLNDGRLTFGVNPGVRRTVTTAKPYNDGRWHHIVASLNGDGMKLYVDGEIAAQNASFTTARTASAYWRVGYDNLGGWPNVPTSRLLDGRIDEFAVYPSALTAAQVARHHAVGAGFVAPTASFVSTVDGRSAAFDASASVAEGGQSVSAYRWDFGDGGTGDGATATHLYAAPGTYQVTLTVTDGRGLVGTTSQQVAVQAPNVLPTAAFVSKVSGLEASVDASTSTDADGTVASYSWNWGDGSAAGAGVSASHAFAKAGTYTIALTVTDDRGGQATKTAEVVVAEAATIARDAFERTATSGWGTAGIGGAWTQAGGAVSAASVSGGVGRLALPAGSTRNLTLNSLSAKNVTMSVDFSLDAAPSTGASYVGLIARSTASDGYTTRAWMNAKGTASIYIQRGSTVLSTYAVPGLSHLQGEEFTLKVDVSGAASTTISAKLWKKGTPEPDAWQTSFTDANGISAAGAVGVHGSRASSATTPVMISVDGFTVVDNG